MIEKRRKFGYDNTVTFEEESHRYFHGIKELKSNSKFLDKFIEPFDENYMSLMVAKSRLGANTINDMVLREQKIVLAEWKEKSKSSIERGNWIHGEMESYDKTGQISNELKHIPKSLNHLWNWAYQQYPEKLLYSLEDMIAGTTDKCVVRQNVKCPVVDFYDYKTNASKGITFDTIKREGKEVKKHYNRYMLFPIDYLECTLYNKYALQLSMYARMAEKTYEIRVGRLAIIYIDLNLEVEVFPVPYMRAEADIMLNHFKNLKEL